MKEKEWTKEEFLSHMSVLTNQRINELIWGCDVAEHQCWLNPCMPNIDRFLSFLMPLTKEIFPFLEESEIENIKKMLKNFFDFYWKVKLSEKTSPTTIIALVQMLHKIDLEIRQYLQKRKFFLRLLPASPRKKGLSKDILEAETIYD